MDSTPSSFSFLTATPKQPLSLLEILAVQAEARRMRSAHAAGLIRKAAKGVARLFAATDDTQTQGTQTMTPATLQTLDTPAKGEFDPRLVAMRAQVAQAEKIADLLIAAGNGVKRVALAVWAPVAEWQAYRAAYNELAALDDRTLADIGINRGDIAHVAKGAWVAQAETGATVTDTAPAAANLNRPRIAA